MIPLRAAELLAQMLPVGLLILAIERRALGPTVFPLRTFKRVWWFTRWIALGLMATAVIVAISLCVQAVIVEEPLTGFWATFVMASSLCLAFSVSIVVPALVMQAFSGSTLTAERPEQTAAPAPGTRRYRRRIRERTEG